MLVSAPPPRKEEVEWTGEELPVGYAREAAINPVGGGGFDCISPVLRPVPLSPPTPHLYFAIRGTPLQCTSPNVLTELNQAGWLCAVSVDNRLLGVNLTATIGQPSPPPPPPHPVLC